MPRKAKEKVINENVPKEDLKDVKPSKVKVSKSKKTDSDTISKSESIKVASTSTKKVASKTTKKKADTASSITKVDDTKATKKDIKEKKITKTASQKKADKKTSSKTTTQKSTAKTTKKATTKSGDKKNTKTIAQKATSKTTKKSASTRKTTTAVTPSPISVEYYDLPYKYNRTVIKLLAKNPNTLFVYWEISDDDIANFQKQYGENFIYITKPFLVIYNLTDGYSFEIEVNDFANNWYIDVNDTKCEYMLELIRKPIQYQEQIADGKLHVISSNVIESPNDRVLFFNENDKIYFKNINTNKYTERVIKPFLKNVLGIYENLSISLDSNNFDFKNPSSHL